MLNLDTSIKRRMMILGLIILAGIFTSFIDSFSSPFLIFVAPGLFFGLALTLPHFDNSRKQIIAITTLPIIMILLWLSCFSIGMFFGIINNSDSDKSGIVVLGIVSSSLFLVILDQYYPIQNKKLTYSIIIILGILSTMIGDTFYLTPHSKELNFGKMIFIWEFLIGFGLTFFARFDWMQEKKETNKK